MVAGGNRLPRHTITGLSLSLILLGSFLLSGTWGWGAAWVPEASRWLLLRSDTIDTGPTQREATATAETNYYIVQFRGAVQEAWKQAVTSLGGRILGYIPENAFIVRMDAATRAVVERLSFVQWVGPYQSRYRVQPGLYGIEAQAGTRTLVVRLFPDENLEGISTRLRGLGGEILDHGEGRWGGKIRLRIDASHIPEAAAIEGVEWVEEFTPAVLFNDVATGIMVAPVVWNTLGLSGTNQIIAIADTGLDTGVTSTLSLDFSGRLLASYALGRPNDWSDPYGHGTHVVGSAVGNGALSGGQYKGMAPGAQLIIQSAWTQTDPLGGLPLNIYDVFLPPYNDGARIHSDSWGEVVSGAYTSLSQEADQFAWDHKEMLLLFAAGNEGRDADGDGVVDLGSLAAPATAKNAIAVGASESYRPERTLTYGSAWPSDFPSAPIAGDRMADNPSGMAAFSSRGPATDGRIKPDLVVPGSYIISARTHYTTTNSCGSWGFVDSNYVYCSGTSMSTPLVAGAAALVRQYYAQVRGVSPSAALVKATLINGASDLNPGQYGTGATREMGPRPNFVEGWGRVNLEASLSSPAPSQLAFADDAVGIMLGESRTYTYTVVGASAPLSVTLTWTDYPSSLAAAVNLVNNLDLTLRDPNGVVYYPNSLAGADGRNNLESIFIAAPVSGTYELRVVGTNVPMGPQPFALVVQGPIVASGTPTPTPTPSTTPTATITATATATPTATPMPSPEPHRTLLILITRNSSERP